MGVLNYIYIENINKEEGEKILLEIIGVDGGVWIKIGIIIAIYIWISRKNQKIKEKKIIMGINMIGAIIIIMSKELFTMYLGLELYSFSTYLLITPKKNTQLQENLSTGIKKINIQYLFYNSFSSILLLIGVYIIYTKTGGFGEIKGYNSGTEDRGIPLELLLIIIALIFKLGGIPYTYWIMRVYPVIEREILLIQLIISKYIYIILLIRLEEIIMGGSGIESIFENVIRIIGLITILYGAYKGVVEKTKKGVITSSSIWTLGLILITVSYITAGRSMGQGGLEGLGLAWELNHAIILYFLNIIILYEVVITGGELKRNARRIQGWLSIMIILSLIGVPPLGGFYSKIYLLTPIISKIFIGGRTPEVGAEAIGIGIIITTTILTLYYYIKIIIKGGIPTPESGVGPIAEDEKGGTPKSTNSELESRGALRIGIISIIIISYTYIIPYIFPFFI